MTATFEPVAKEAISEPLTQPARDEVIVMAPKLPHPVSKVERLAEVVQQMPLEAVASLNDWVSSVIEADPGHPEEASVGLASFRETVAEWTAKVGESSDCYASIMKSQLDDAAVFAAEWIKLRVLLDRSLSTPLVRVDGRTRVISPEGAAFDLFLEEAVTRRWMVHNQHIYEDHGGVVAAVGKIADVLRDVIARQSKHVSSYMQERPGALAAVCKQVGSGADPRLPCVLLDTTRIKFNNVIVRMTEGGLNLDPIIPIDYSMPTTPRAAINCDFGEASAASIATVTALFPDLRRSPEPILRLLGAILRPTLLRSTDRWSVAIVATAPEGSVHVIERICSLFLGHAVVSNLTGFNPSMAPKTVDPFCLMLRASPTGALTPQQLSCIQIAAVCSMPIVILGSVIPAHLCSDPSVRLCSVLVDQRTPVPEETFASALPHILPVTQAYYNMIPATQKMLVSPLYDDASFGLRLNPTTTDAVVSLLAEMLQVHFGFRLRSRGHAAFAAIKTSFDLYQTKRGYSGFAKMTPRPQDVIDACELIRSLHPSLKTVGSVVYAESTAGFANLAVV